MKIISSNARSISFKKESNKTSIKHNNRDFEYEEWNKKYHEHINQELTKNNQYLIQKDIHNVYDELFGEAVVEYNAKQKRKDRKIDNYFNHVKNSKTLNLQQEFIIQIGDINNYVSDEFKDNLPRNDKGNIDYKKLSGCETDTVKENKRIANEILEEYVKDFEERNPNLKIYNAVIHNDEVSPHLHINVVPVATGYKRGVNVQPSFNKALEQQNLSGDTPLDIFKSFRQQELSAIENIMRDYNLERKRVGTNEIKDIHEYKQVMSEVAQVKEQVKETKQELDKLDKVKDIVKGQLDSMIDLKNTLEEKGKWESYSDEWKIKQAKEYFPNPLNKNDKLEKAEMILELKDRAFATDSVIFAYNKFLRTSSIDISKEIESGLERKIEPYKDKIEKLEKENQKLLEENRKLYSSNSILKRSLNVLRDTVREIIVKCSRELSKAFFERLGANMSKQKLRGKVMPINAEEELWVNQGINSERKSRKVRRGQELEL